MWVFTKEGFFSVTLNQRDESGDTLLVRARVRGDLVNLIDYVEDMDQEAASACFDDDPIIETPHADYRYRVVMPRYWWGYYLSMVVDDLDYTNVKDTLAPMSTESVRHGAMMGVWASMGRLQPGGPYGEGYWDPHVDVPDDYQPSLFDGVDSDSGSSN